MKHGPWSDAFAVEAFGALIAVRVDDPAGIAGLYEALPIGCRTQSGGLADLTLSVAMEKDGEPGAIYEGETLVARPRSRTDGIEDFVSRLRFGLAQFARTRIVVHGGAVSWNGKVAVFPARTHSGKSHLVAQLIKAGADYFSDEHIVLDDAGRVHPWPIALSMRQAGRARQRATSPAEFGARVATAPLPLSLIVSTRFRRNARWRPRRLTPSEGAIELLNNTIAARLYPERAMRAAGAAAAAAAAIKSDRPDAGRVVDRILRELELCR